MPRNEGETITRILQAAAQQFSERGFHGASARDIGDAAGLAKGHLYYYFESKEELLYRILLSTVQHQLAGLREVLERRVDPVERLRRAVRFHIAFAAAYSDLMALVGREVRHLGPERRHEVEAAREEYVGLLANILRAGITAGCLHPVDPRLTALAILGMCHHVATRYRSGAGLRPAEISEQIIELLSVPLIRSGEGGTAAPPPGSAGVDPTKPGKGSEALTLAEIIRRNGRLYPHKTAFVAGGRSATFAEFDARTDRLANAFMARGLRKGDRIAILANNCLEYLEVYGAAEKGGFVLAPLNFNLTGGEIADLVQVVRPRALVVQRRHCDLVTAFRSQLLDVEIFLLLPEGAEAPGGEFEPYETFVATGAATPPPVSVQPENAAYLIFTSGTTGLPRSAMLSHYGQWMDAMAIAAEMALSPLDRHLAVMPLYHVGGRALVLAHTLRGCTVVIHDGFDAAAVLGAIEQQRLTTLQVVPTMVVWMLEQLQQQSYDLTSLRLIWYASAPMPPELLQRALQAFGSIFIQGYGQTEAGPLVTVLHPHEHETEGEGVRRLASCGRPSLGVDVRVVRSDGSSVAEGEVGEITVRSPFVMLGYWERPELTADVIRDGWLHTGDVGTVDNEGFIYIVDRRKDMIISGGENIYPREIEDVLFSHPAVAEVAVIGIPDETWGESVMAYVVPRPGATVAEAELIDYCSTRLGVYKRPKRIELRNALPHSPSGKVLKNELRRPHWEGKARQV